MPVVNDALYENKAYDIKISHRRYIDLQISYYFRRLEVKIADTRSEMLALLIKMFIGQLAGFISVIIALANLFEI